MQDRFSMFFLTLLMPALVLAASPADPPEALVWVDRQSDTDLTTLLEANVPVVMESGAGLFVFDRGGGRERLSALGFTSERLDADSAAWDYWVVGLRPDSNVPLLQSTGTVLQERENWILLRVPRYTPLSRVAHARVFVSLVPRATMRPPVGAPAAVETGLRENGRTPTDPLVQKIVDAMTDSQIDQLWQDVTSNPPTGTRYTYAQGCEDAADYCYDHLAGLGLDVEYDVYNTSHAPNVVGTITGAVNPDDIYVVLGHLDDLPEVGVAPGADDNASGSVNVLAAAEAMSCYAYENTVKFLAVTGEEVGLVGSTAWAAAAQARGDNILGAINMDMIGWQGNALPDPENLDLNYNSGSQWLAELFAEAATKYGTGLVVDAFSCPNMAASDHWPFWQRGWSAVLGITDNEGYCGHGGNYPYYHTSNDTIGNCGDPAFFYSVVRASTATLAELARPFKITMTEPLFACGSQVEVLVGDRDLDTNPAIQESIVVEVWSSTETTREMLTLLEQDVSAMNFSGLIPTTTDPPSAGDGVLSVTAGDTVFAEYVDAVDCDGSLSVPYTATVPIDCGAPIISGVATGGVTDTQASISWTTNEPATSTVHWGTSVPPQNVTSLPDMTFDHAVPLTGLVSCTSYYYSVESEDTAGNPTTDDNGGQYYRFETYGDFGAGLQPCHAGRVSLDAPVYRCGDVVGFEVVDMDLNLDPGAIESTTLAVSSSSESVPETVLVTEAGANSSTFTGTISADVGEAQADGLLQCGDGDLLTATYLDADDGSGVPAISYDTATLDCKGPEILDLSLRDVTDQRLSIEFETSEPASAVIDWGPTPALGQSIILGGTALTHSAAINQLAACQPLYLRVSCSDTLGNSTVADLGGLPFEALSWEIPGLYWRETFETGAPGWSLNGEWEVGTPQGLGGWLGHPDPLGAYNNGMALGTDLTGLGSYPGDYEHLALDDADSPVLDAQSWSNTKLLLYRQLNVRQDDEATIWALDSNSQTQVYTSNLQVVSQNGYAPMALDLSGVVDGEHDVQIRFRIDGDFRNPFTDDGIASGWNIDDVILKDGSLPDYGPCGGCITAPAYGGVSKASDLDACGAGGVLVSWDPAVAWGSGGQGSYAVYRDTVPGFTPTPANLVAAGVPGPAYQDAGAPQDQTLYYVVRAENDETCSTGPDNGGMTDGNLVSVGVAETTNLASPDPVTTLRVDRANPAHVRLDWLPAARASTYVIYRSMSPEPVNFSQLDETSDVSFEDLGQGGSASSWYYLVRSVNACGVETP